MAIETPPRKSRKKSPSLAIAIVNFALIPIGAWLIMGVFFWMHTGIRVSLSLLKDADALTVEQSRLLRDHEQLTFNTGAVVAAAVGAVLLVNGVCFLRIASARRPSAEPTDL